MSNVAGREGCPIIVGTTAVVVYVSGIVLAISWATGIAHDAGSFGVVIGVISAGIMIYLFENTRGWNIRMKQNKMLALEKQDEDNINIVRHIIRQCQIIALPILRKGRLTEEDIQSVVWFLQTQMDYVGTMYHRYVTQDGLDHVAQIRETAVNIITHKIPSTRQSIDKIIVGIFELESEVKDKNDHGLAKIRDMASG